MAFCLGESQGKLFRCERDGCRGGGRGGEGKGKRENEGVGCEGVEGGALRGRRFMRKEGREKNREGGGVCGGRKERRIVRKEERDGNFEKRPGEERKERGGMRVRARRIKGARNKKKDKKTETNEKRTGEEEQERKKGCKCE